MFPLLLKTVARHCMSNKSEHEIEKWHLPYGHLNGLKLLYKNDKVERTTKHKGAG